VSGATASYPALISVRAVGGYSTAVAFVVGSALAARLRPALLPIYFAGPGAGVVIASLLVPEALAHNPDSGWKMSWILLGLVAAAATFGAWRAEAHVPEHQGRHAASLTRSQFRSVGPIFVAYVLFGAGYVSFMTFVVELLRDRGVGNWTSAAFFLVLGVSSAVTTVLWGKPLRRLQGGRGLAVVSAVALVGAMPVLVRPSVSTAFVSAIVFGGSFMAGPAAVTALCRRCLPADAWAAGIAILTTGFAVGQKVGPVASGLISDHIGGGVRSGLWVSPILLLVAGAVALRQRETPAEAILLVESAADVRRAA
jgi:predicted MFS family arabinose efflux permease